MYIHVYRYIIYMYIVHVHDAFSFEIFIHVDSIFPVNLEVPTLCIMFLYIFFSPSTQLHEVQKRIGYCPQFDAIIELLTGRELLTMFGRLRGIPERMIKEAVQFEINRLDLSKHADKKCGTYR